MSKRPEGRKRRQNTFQQFRKIPEADFVLIPLPMLETAIFPESVHSGIQQSVHSSYSLSFTTPALPGS